jgi:peptidoglycan/xylan/chitin deacetylase (PgdA/CDA1 family)
MGAALAACVLAAGSALASECPGNPNAIGTARTITVDPAKLGRVGTIQYPDTLPLRDKEVVLTFDDGPLPPYSDRILGILAAECIKATFFIVGRQAQAHPDIVRRLHDAGHTIASHSQNHPGAFASLTMSRITSEIDEGIASTTAALGETRSLAPFFRFPGLRRSDVSEAYLASLGLMAWSADIPSDDWRGISADTVIARTLGHLERKGKGVVLMHDIQPVTTVALPDLLRELKVRGYRIVHVVPAGTRRRPIAVPQDLALRQPPPIWPRVSGPVGAAVAKESENPPEPSPVTPYPRADSACAEQSRENRMSDWCGRANPDGASK